jgi:hypothetical protein
MTGSVRDGILQMRLQSGQSRLEDLLELVVNGNEPPASGAITFDTAVALPPGREEFLRRVRLNGQFAIQDGRFLHADTQGKLDELSKRASSGDRKNEARTYDVQATASADFTDAGGITHFRKIDFRVPGARATATGTFNLLSKAVALDGTLAMEASLSAAAGGWKRLFLLPLDPFFKKGSAGAVVPIHVRGTYSHPTFKASLRNK